MILFTLVACQAPGTLGSVGEALGRDVVDAAELPLRMTTAIAGLLAETCGVGELEDYVFSSWSAQALGVASAVVTRGEDGQTWRFDGSGLDGVDGTLTLLTDATQERFDVTWSGGGATLTGELEFHGCDADGVALVGGGTWSDDVTGVTVAVADNGEGVLYAPPTAPVPTGGQLRAAAPNAKWLLLLDDAGQVEAGFPAWPGVASGADFSVRVTIAWP